jgi:acyl-CoA synthetase (AMP-forming)/AMP-acid ligase II
LSKANPPGNGRIGEPSTLVELLRGRASQRPEQQLYTYLVDGETEGASLTLAVLDRQARAIGALLQSGEARGERALLLYPAGLEFIPAFFGCLFAGAIAVPLPLPNLAQPQRTLQRLRTIVRDAYPMVVLTTSSILAKVESLFMQAPELRRLRWLATDKLDLSSAQDWQESGVRGNMTALLQYTSGSTAEPRGVMVSHANLIENSAHISQAFELTAESVSVTWLPVFHDMGLTNGIVQPLYGGRQCVMMSPQSFLQRPLNWLQAISRYRATISGGPNFAYEMCVRKVTSLQAGALDLRAWKLAYSGAEPVRADTLRRFADAFASYGFQPRSFYPCYGLAEATLIVSGGVLKEEPVLFKTEVAALEDNRVEASYQDANGRTLVGCGRAMADSKVIIVNPETLRECPPDEIGEIWASGPSVTQGYWKRPRETAFTFDAYLTDTGEGPFLRTGDLGFLIDGELFVTGRLKDLIIIGGRNLYPHDLEMTVEQSHPALRPGGCVAFSVDVDDEERLIIAAELQRHYYLERKEPSGVERKPPDASYPKKGILQHRQSAPDVEVVTRAIRGAVAEAHDVRVHAVVLLKPGGIPKTPSGKVQRRVCGARYRSGTLEHSAQNK